jgi:hypothetical protein
MAPHSGHPPHQQPKMIQEVFTQEDLDGSFEIAERDRLKQLQDKFEAVIFTPLEVGEVEIYN